MTDGGCPGEAGIRWTAHGPSIPPSCATHPGRDQEYVLNRIARSSEPRTQVPKLSPCPGPSCPDPSLMPLNMPQSAGTPQLALDPLMQCPQELSRPWRMAGQRAGPSLHPEAALLAPRLSLGHCHPWVCLLCRGGDHRTTSPRPGILSETSQRSHGHEPSGLRVGPSSKRQE